MQNNIIQCAPRKQTINNNTNPNTCEEVNNVNYYIDTSAYEKYLKDI